MSGPRRAPAVSGRFRIGREYAREGFREPAIRHRFGFF